MGLRRGPQPPIPIVMPSLMDATTSFAVINLLAMSPSLLSVVFRAAHAEVVPPEAYGRELVRDVVFPVDDGTAIAELQVEVGGRLHVERDHLVVGVLTQSGRELDLALLHAVHGTAHFGHVVHLHHHMHAARSGRELGQRQTVVTSVGAVEEMNAHRRAGIACGLEVVDVRKTKAQYIAHKGHGLVEVGSGQHGMAQAIVAGDEA
ncbi:hypothetical protein SDC9_172326 [bioreactor metagenome]|uniref:Uncharacterized protein n=1 Tax=bioreactor metagenome TaxID=1076179 RepID=A0A645GDC6_9ZZZZ